MQTLTEFGAMWPTSATPHPNAGRYVDGINEAREVHPYYGRRPFFKLPLLNLSM